MREYDFGCGVARVHAGKLSESERRAILERASKNLYIAICAEKAQKKEAR